MYTSFLGNRRKTMDGYSKTRLLPTLHVYIHRLYPKSSGAEFSAVVFGQHVHPILVLVIFSSGIV
jgi:hypothetical protein